MDRPSVQDGDSVQEEVWAALAALFDSLPGDVEVTEVVSIDDGAPSEMTVKSLYVDATIVVRRQLADAAGV